MDRQQHWDAVYRTKGDSELSWFQAAPRTSISLIRALHPMPASAIDVGGGQSALAGALLDAGIRDVVVLDIAPAAIERGRARLGARADRVAWIIADVLDAPALGPVDLWHDRAVFHFLTDPADRRRYVDAAARAVRPGGHAIIATFAPTGPERCSGLPVQRYGADALATEFAPAFTTLATTTEGHTTPWGKTQDFTYTVLARPAI